MLPAWCHEAPLAVGATAVGVVVGMLVPKRTIEDHHIGQRADDVNEQAWETGQAALTPQELDRPVAAEGTPCAEPCADGGDRVREEVQLSAALEGKLTDSCRGRGARCPLA